MAEDELRSLAARLEADRSVCRHLQSELTSGLARVPGQQGDGIDILSLILSSGPQRRSPLLSPPGVPLDHRRPPSPSNVPTAHGSRSAGR
ncbi:MULTISPECIES: effector-associated constant component EACC1 [Streptomyces]|uniref:effector-associated constant component EACC1 n=1 Tax=Streptomyces TaxID=1883 RepID=UPI003608F99F